MDCAVTGNDSVYFGQHGVRVIEVFQDGGGTYFGTAVIGKGKLRDIALQLNAWDASAIDIQEARFGLISRAQVNT